MSQPPESNESTDCIIEANDCVVEWYFLLATMCFKSRTQSTLAAITLTTFVVLVVIVYSTVLILTVQRCNKKPRETSSALRYKRTRGSTIIVDDDDDSFCKVYPHYCEGGAGIKPTTSTAAPATTTTTVDVTTTLKSDYTEIPCPSGHEYATVDEACDEPDEPQTQSLQGPVKIDLSGAAGHGGRSMKPANEQVWLCFCSAKNQEEKDRNDCGCVIPHVEHGAVEVLVGPGVDVLIVGTTDVGMTIEEEEETA